ncbi:MAG TPA: GspH/FimT family pseudopilin [Albitalea sp.]|nr:GspH/FimT family pseudopilin [Albitalea sp.]
MLSPRCQAGFTLIELMVALTVMALLLLLGAPSFSTWLQNSQIRTASEAMANGLQVARAEAVRRNAPVRFQLTDKLDNSCVLSSAGRNWIVSLDDVTGACGLAPSADLAAPTPPRIVQKRAAGDGTPNAEVAAADAAGTAISAITFNGLGRASTAANINITNTHGGDCAASNGPMRCMRVAVSAGGQIRLCDPKFSSSDPLGCP